MTDLNLQENNIRNELINKNQKKTNKKIFTIPIIILIFLIIISFILAIMFYIMKKIFVYIIFLIICIIITLAILIIIICQKEKNIQKQELKQLTNIKEDEKLNKLKKEMFLRQKYMRKENDESKDDIINNNIIIGNKEKKEEKRENKKINAVLEDMCIYGNLMKKEILKEKEENPEKFIDTKDALKLEQENQDLFALGLLAQNLEDEGIEAFIEKENDVKDEQDAGSTCLQFITSGLYNKTKYDLHFDLDEKRSEEILNNEEEYEKFKNDLKLKLRKDYNVPLDKIIVTLPQKGSLHIQVIFQSDEFNNLDKNDFINKFKNDNEFKELQNLKEIHSDVVLNVCKLTKSMLDKRGNRSDGWGINEKRGNKPYDPPIGWIGIGLNVIDKYDNGNNNWIGMNNSEGEWCVAYHGVGRFNKSDEIKNISGAIIKGGFRAGKNQVHKKCKDKYHPGKTVGEGVYCTPHIATAQSYSGKSIINGKFYHIVLMVRVKPDKIRGCEDSGDYWVVSGTTEDIRPYRILYKCA